jgi:hypothetical protein
VRSSLHASYVAWPGRLGVLGPVIQVLRAAMVHRRHLLSATEWRTEMADRFAVGRQVTAPDVAA